MTTAATPRGRPFKPGQSGNPSGRPRGARHRTTVLCEQLLAGEAAAVVRAVLTAAASGDMAACRMVLDRVVPPVKERPLNVTLPADLDTAAGIAAAHALIVRAVACGDLLPAEGSAVSALLDGQRRAFETEKLAARIKALEGNLR